MNTYRTALRIVWGHRLYVLIYLIMVDLLGVLMALNVAETPLEPGAPVEELTPTVAVIDRDGSEISAGVRRYVEGIGEVVPLEDDLHALQDATAKDRITYILVIPEGYGEDLMVAASTGSDAPSLERVVSYSSAAGSLVDVRVTSYLQGLYGFAATLDGSPADVVASTDSVMGRRAKASYVEFEATTLPESVLIYSRFSTYPLFASITVCLALLMKQLNAPAVRNRVRASALPNGRRGRQLLAACLTIGLVAWAWVCLVGLVAFGLPYLGTAAPQLAVVAVSLLAYALVAVAIGFLLGQFGVGENASNAIANVGGMVMSFLGGAWVSIELLPEAVVAVAHFVPSYWCMQAIDGACTLTEVAGASIGPLLADIGIAALFALAILTVALSVGRARVQEA